MVVVFASHPTYTPTPLASQAMEGFISDIRRHFSVFGRRGKGRKGSSQKLKRLMEWANKVPGEVPIVFSPLGTEAVERIVFMIVMERSWVRSQKGVNRPNTDMFVRVLKCLSKKYPNPEAFLETAMSVCAVARRFSTFLAVATDESFSRVLDRRVFQHQLTVKGIGETVPRLVCVDQIMKDGDATDAVTKIAQTCIHLWPESSFSRSESVSRATRIRPHLVVFPIATDSSDQETHCMRVSFVRTEDGRIDIRHLF